MTHSEHDTNNDHKIVFNSVMMSTRPGIYTALKKLLSFEVLSSSEWSFTQPFAPNFFETLEISNVQDKWKALACFQTEIKDYPHPRSEEGILTLARYRGMQSGVSFAEAFKIIRDFN